MRWHIIAALGTMREVIGIFWHQAIEKLFQVAARGRIGVFHDEKATTGVLNKHRHCPVSHFGPVDLRLQIIRDLRKNNEGKWIGWTIEITEGDRQVWQIPFIGAG